MCVYSVNLCFLSCLMGAVSCGHLVVLAGLFSRCSLIHGLEQFIFQTALGQNGLHVKEMKFSCACSSCDKSPV